METFTSEIVERLKAYVYRIEDPRTGSTFYVGKGNGDRAFAHARQALTGEDGLRYERIREIIAAGHTPRVIIHRHGLDDAVAHEVESALIDAYAHEDLANEVRGHDSERGVMTPRQIVELYGAAPAQIPVPAILIKIEQQWHQGLSAEELYERTRRYWVCNPESRPIPPQIAISVARGIVREVFDIEKWEVYPDMAAEVIDPTRLPARKKGKAMVRRGFLGRVTADADLRASLLGTSVREIPFGSGSPFAYAGPTARSDAGR